MNEKDFNFLFIQQIKVTKDLTKKMIRYLLKCKYVTNQFMIPTALILVICVVGGVVAVIVIEAVVTITRSLIKRWHKPKPPLSASETTEGL